MLRMMVYNFQAKIALRGYQVCKNVIGDNMKAGDKVSVELETDNESIKTGPYYYATKAIVGKPAQLKQLATFREKSQDTHSFSKGRE